MRRAVNIINTSTRIFWASRIIGICVFLLYLALHIFNFGQLSKPVDSSISVGRAYLQAFAPILTSGGIIGAVLTWLLQTIHDTECGVEIGVIYRRKYPHYPANLVCLALSTSICAFCMLSAPISGGWMVFILVTNGIGLCAELAYIMAMTWSFLLRQSIRKMNTYKYLQECVKTSWSDSHQLRWETFELICLIKDFPYASSWYYNCPTGWLFNQWVARYHRITSQQPETAPVIKVNETAALIERITAAISNPQTACDVLGNFIYDCYLVSRSIAPAGQVSQQGILPPSAQDRVDKLLDRYRAFDEVDRQFSNVKAEEREAMLVLFISAWAVDMLKNDRPNNALPDDGGPDITQKICDCMDTIGDAIVYANCLHMKRMRDPNQWASDLSFVCDRSIKNINGFILFIWSSALCFFLNNNAPNSERNTTQILSYEKDVATRLAGSGLIDTRSQEYSTLTFGWLCPEQKCKHRHVKDWLAEVKVIVDILLGRPVMTDASSATKEIEEVYTCRCMVDSFEKETEREKVTL